MTDVKVKAEPLVYERNSPHSFLRDLLRSQVLKDDAALGRLNEHQRQVDVLEQRTNPSGTLGFGGEFDPPAWLIDHFKTASRAGRSFADLLNPVLLPPNVQSVNVPKIVTGTVTAVQPAQGAAVASQDMTASTLTSPVVTIAGEADVSQQLVDLTPIGFDTVASLDLTRDYNLRLEQQVINGTGTNGQLLGIANFSSPTTVSGSGGTTFALAWPLIGQACAQVGTARGLPPEALLMAPRRWFWIASAFDGSNATVMPPGHGTLHVDGTLPLSGGVAPFGPIFSLPVYTAGAIAGGASADNVYAVRPSDMYLFESAPRFVVLQQVVSGTLQVRLQLRRYVAFVGNAYTTGLGIVTALPQPTGF